MRGMIFCKKGVAALLTALCIWSVLPVGVVSAAENADTKEAPPDVQNIYGGGYAVTGQLPNVGYQAKLYDASNGLPTSDANCVLGASDGYVYIGGYSGIIRYDGSSFEHLDATDGLTSGRAIFEDDKHRLWVGTNDNGVVVLDGESRRHYTYEDGLPSSSIRTFAQGSDGNIYIGTTSGIVYADSADTLRRLSDGRLNSQIISRMASGPDGKVYGSTKNGDIFVIENEKLTAFHTSAEIGVGMISTIFPDPRKAGKVYLGTESKYVYHGVFGKRKDSLTKINVSPADSIYYIDFACGRIWITSENTAGYIDRFNVFHELTNVPMDNSIDMMAADYQGNLWFASSRQGAMKVVTSNFRDLTAETDIDFGTVNATCLSAGRLYVGTDSGLFILDRDMNPVQNALTEYLGQNRIRCITEDRKGNLWVSTYTNELGLVCYTTDHQIESYTVKNGMPDNRVRESKVAKDGSLLVCTNGGLAIIKDGKIVQTVVTSQIVRNTVFLTVCEDDDGTLYLGSDGDGIYVIDETGTHRIGREDGLTSDVILKIKKDPENGVLWIVTSNSFEYMRDGQITNVDTFPYNNNFDIFTDMTGDIWVLSSNGIYCVNGQDAIRNEIKDYKLYTLANGLPGAPTSNSFSAMDGNGNLYMTARTGVCLVNIYHFFEQDAKIKTAIKSISFNDEPILPDASGKYTIPASVGRIQITPAILDYTMTNPLVHIYLEGEDETGITCEQSDLVALEYTNLAYGKYKLHIEILEKTTKRILQDEVTAIEKLPRVTELLIVRLLLLVLLALVAGLIVWWVMRTTIIRRQYAEIRAAKDEAERANSAKSRFLANMSHEIRTPINTIMGMNEMVMREDATGVPKGYFMSMMNYAFDIRNASESLLSLINDLLDISKIESGKMHLVEQEYDVQEMLRSIISMIRVRSNEKDLTFDVVVDEAVPSRLYGDVGKIKQIVLNLLTNAVKYTREGGFVLRVSMEERADESAGLRFSVKDTGIGVKEEDLEKLFTAYERLDEEKNSAIQGTGLGLDISRRFAELMGGHLWCESVYGEGSEFILTVSQRIIDETPIGAFSEHADHEVKGPYVPKFVAPDANILVVDDEPMNLNVIKSLLKATKVLVATASGGKEALEKIRDHHFDVVLLDHMMPGMDGIETVAKIREGYPDLPVYALTANSTAGEEFYQSKGFNGYLSKPIECEVLEETLMRHLPEEMMQQPEAFIDAEELTEIPENLKWIYETDGITVEEGIQNSGGVSNYIIALELFLDTIDESAKVLKEAYGTQNFKLYTIKVHALKSSARIIGATELSELAASLEDAGNRQDIDYIDQHADELMTQYLAFKEKLRGIKETADNDEREMIPEEELSDAYGALREVIPQMDYDAVEMILDNLKEYKLPKEDAEKIEKISIMLKSFDWDGMEKLFSEEAAEG
ncbi:MAG: response regulator [Lachnospiraceae bacterium]|nr:response regulator [Lachnospiraceae bacterium]